jgi:CO/xanthine dehydrogenase Mo-binding subunit
VTEETGALGRLDRWIRLAPDGKVTLLSGKVEIGQAIATALAQCVADELDVAFDRVVVPAPDTDTSPDEGFTAGSRSIEESGETLRRIAAEVRALLLERAAARLGSTPDALAVDDGTVTGPSGAAVTYWEVADASLLAREASGAVAPKAPAARRVIGRRVPRIDLAAKIVGEAAYVQDLVLPGMLHGRVVRPPSQAATLESIDDASLRGRPGVVAVVRDGSFVGVIAETEIAAIRARRDAQRLTTWSERATLPPTLEPRYLLREPSALNVALDRAAQASPAGARTLSGEFTRPFLAHAALGPSCAVAVLEGERYTIWSHTQGIHPLRHEIAKVLRIPDDRVRVIHMDGAGCYGHNGADDASLDAALLARAVPGRPVRVQWMRDDEFAWEPFGTSSVVRVSADLAGSRIAAWTTEIWSHGHGNRPTPSTPADAAGLLAARHLERPFTPTRPRASRSLTSAALRNAQPLYRIPAQRVLEHHVAEQPLRCSALRSLGAHVNVFAIESLMDELAAAADQDPLAFRLAHLDDARGRAVIEKAAAMAGWGSALTGSSEAVRGRGIAFARYKNAAAYFACVVEVELARDIRVARVWGAIDSGMAVSPDGILNQAEGGIVQATSWTLKEQVTYDGTRVTSLGWDSYPTLTFSEVPEVEVALIDRPDEPPLGTGEAFAGPVSAAIANAVYDASGVRLRDLPLTRRRLVAAMDAVREVAKS